MDEDEIKTLIWNYTYYRGIAKATGGENPWHCNFEHHQNIIKMCDDKIQELQEQLDELLRSK